MMTVKIERGQAPTPLWALVTLTITILLGASGWAAYAIQRGADVEHRILQQSNTVQENEITDLQDKVKDQQFAIADLRTGQAVIIQKLDVISGRLK